MPTAGMDGAAGKRCIFLRKAFQKGKVRPDSHFFFTGKTQLL
jgi:hypothetical protein